MTQASRDIPTASEQQDRAVPDSGTVSAGRFPITPGVIGALAAQTLRQCVRRKVLFVLALYAAVLLVAAAVIPSHDPARRVSALISLCLTVISFFGVIVAVFLAAMVLPEDRAKKTIATLMTKPVGRLNYLLGRVAGFALTLGIILLAMAVAAWGFLRWQAADAGRASGRTDLLTAKRGIDPAEVFMREGTRTLELKPGFAPSLSGATSQTLVLGFRKGLELLRAGDQRLEMRPSIATGAKLPRTDATVVVSNPKSRESRTFQVMLDSDRVTAVDFPASLVHPSEGVVITLQRHESGTYVSFAPGALQLMIPPAPFEWALAKAILMVFLGLVLVIVVSVAASTFLSSWVAVLLALTAYLFATFQQVLIDFMQGLSSGKAGFLGERLYEHTHDAPEKDTLLVALVNKIFYGGLWTLTHMFPNFQRFDASTFLTAARDVPVAAVVSAAALMAAYAVCYLALAHAVFHKRELMP